MSDIYDQHKAAFASVSAYVIAKDGDRVATVAFKYPRDGAGRLWCYVHVLGVPMVRGHAGGYGYDKHSAASEVAFARISDVSGLGPSRQDAILQMRDALARDSGEYWDSRLRKAASRCGRRCKG